MGGDTYSPFPIRVVYDLADRKPGEEHLKVFFDYWEDKVGSPESPKHVLEHQGRLWKAAMWKENQADWEYVRDNPRMKQRIELEVRRMGYIEEPIAPDCGPPQKVTVQEVAEHLGKTPKGVPYKFPRLIQMAIDMKNARKKEQNARTT